jgi:glycosyltransferase involved in cell wall biosynthesis
MRKELQSSGMVHLSEEQDLPEISVVTTVLNERKGIRHLLDSLVVQSPRHEIIVVDAGSKDGTWEILVEYAGRYPEVRPFQYPGRRGAGRNAGVRMARANRVAFIDGDCIANAFWLERLIESFEKGVDIVAGRTIYTGYWAFTNMERVELPHKGQDTTWPSCNLAYRKEAFLAIGGFDERFITAEDIDLNFRAIDAGYRLSHNDKAVVYARARDSVKGFLHQAYWNGYGRKQLTLKHGRLWHEYSFRDMIRRQSGFWAAARMNAAVMGYLACKRRERPEKYRVDGTPRTNNRALTGDYGDDHPAPKPARPRVKQETKVV